MSNEIVVDYVIVNSDSPTRLSEKVLVYARTGYVPAGGPFVWVGQMAQALVLYGRKVDERPVISYGTGQPPPGEIPVR